MARLRIKFRENGSIAIEAAEGTQLLLNGELRTLDRPNLALCRCGSSASKPFCDGSHKRVGFVAPEGVAEIELDI